jgi:hypothetical protein
MSLKDYQSNVLDALAQPNFRFDLLSPTGCWRRRQGLEARVH